MRPSTWTSAVIVAVVVLAAIAATAAPETDDYIRGYAAAILAREFKVRAPSLQVSRGVVRLAAPDLDGLDRAAVVAALKAIDGVASVVVADSIPAAAAPPSVTPAAGPSDAAPIALLETGFMPSGLLFKPLLADPRWPHFSLGYRKYFDDDDFGQVVAGGIGENLPLYRWTTSAAGQWEIGALALVTPLFDRDRSEDLITEDYLLGLFLGWRRGALSGLARLYHTSAHLGDELALRGTVPRVNLSYETLDARLSWDFTPELRAYGGAGYIVRREPRSLDPWSLQLGFEYRSAWRAWQLLRPVGAIDLQGREEHDWQPALSLRAGAQLDSATVLGRSLQFLLEYYNGDSRDGQFFTREVEYLGFGAHFNF